MVKASTAGAGPEELADHRLSEAAVTLAWLVLTGDDPGGLVRETVLAVATALDADRCELLRPEPGSERLVRVVSCGEDAGRGGRDIVPCGVSSVAGYALLCGTPVVSGDLEEERRFGAMGAPRRSGPVSAVAAPFQWGEDCGVLAAYAVRADAFDARHALSVGRISSLLGGALWRLEEREELRRRAEGTGRPPGASSSHPHEGTPECEGPTPTGRQLEVLALMSDGRSAKRIASELSLSIHTVHFHQRNLYRTLGVGSSTGALKRAAQLGLLPLPHADPAGR